MVERHLFNCMFHTEVVVCSGFVLDCNILMFFQYSAVQYNRTTAANQQ